MILSQQSIFSDDQAITTASLSTNVMDLGVAGTPYDGFGPLNQDIGKGTMVPFLVSITEDLVGPTSLTVTIEVSDNEDMSNSTVLVTESITDLTSNGRLYTQCLPNGVDKRYLAVRYAPVGGAATAGTVTAGITKGNQTNFTGV